MIDERGDRVCPKCQQAETVVGIEVGGVYDGVLFWECIEDGTKWHRWPEGHRLHAEAEGYMYPMGKRP